MPDQKQPEHEIFGFKFDSEDVDYIAIKRDGRTITISKDKPNATIQGFAAKSKSYQEARGDRP